MQSIEFLKVELEKINNIRAVYRIDGNRNILEEQFGNNKGPSKESNLKQQKPQNDNFEKKENDNEKRSNSQAQSFKKPHIHTALSKIPKDLDAEEENLQEFPQGTKNRLFVDKEDTRLARSSSKENNQVEEKKQRASIQILIPPDSLENEKIIEEDHQVSHREEQEEYESEDVAPLKKGTSSNLNVPENLNIHSSSSVDITNPKPSLIYRQSFDQRRNSQTLNREDKRLLEELKKSYSEIKQRLADLPSRLVPQLDSNLKGNLL